MYCLFSGLQVAVGQPVPPMEKKMKKTLMMLALPLLMTSAFAQTSTTSEGSPVIPKVTSTTTRADVKADLKASGSQSTKNTDVIRPAAMAKTPDTVPRSRADVKAETAAAANAGELNKPNQLVTPADTMTAEQKTARADKARAKRAKAKRAKAKREAMRAEAKTADTMK
jgi:hypothetical protein